MAPAPDPDKLGEESRLLIEQARRLREVSDRLIEEIATLRRLEDRSRELAIGSPEFEEISEDITDHVRSVFRMSAEQVKLAAQARPQDRTLNDVPSEDDG